MKQIISFFFIVFYFGQLMLFAQNDQNIINDRFNGLAAGGAKLTPNTVMYGFDNSPATVVGNGYLDTFWHTGYIIFYPQDNKPITDDNPLESASDLSIRWDIHRNEIDVKLKNRIFGVKGNTVYEFGYVDLNGRKRIFKNHAAISMEFERTNGFYEVLSKGDVLLLKKYEAIIKPPTFNPALNIGEKDYIFAKNESFYYAKKRNIEKIKPKKSLFLDDIMVNRKSEIDKYFSINDLNLKKENDLVKLFEFYNSLK